MPRSKILDRGEEVATIYPEVRETNGRGEVYKTPGETGYTVRVTVTADKQAIAELPGQVHVKVVRMFFRWPESRGKLGSNARIVFRGEDWDMSVPPHYSYGASRAMRHVELIIKSRNRLGGGKHG